jgi:hypothetical protein
MKSEQIENLEERGLENQIKRLKDILPSTKGNDRIFPYTAKFLSEQMTTIIEDLEDIKLSIKSENDRILTNKLKGNK